MMIRALKPKGLPARGVGAAAVLVVRGVWEETQKVSGAWEGDGDHVHLRAEALPSCPDRVVCVQAWT